MVERLGRVYLGCVLYTSTKEQKIGAALIPGGAQKITNRTARIYHARRAARTAGHADSITVRKSPLRARSRAAAAAASQRELIAKESDEHVRDGEVERVARELGGEALLLIHRARPQLLRRARQFV